jgi:hypothetical protein
VRLVAYIVKADPKVLKEYIVGGGEGVFFIRVV